MAFASYASLLRTVPAFRACPRSALAQIASLVDTLELPPGTMLGASSREMMVTLAPIHVVVIERRALQTVIDLAPDLEPRT